MIGEPLKIEARFDREWTCPHCNATYQSIGRLTCGDPFCLDLEMKRQGFVDASRTTTSRNADTLALKAAGIPTVYSAAKLTDFDGDHAWKTRKSVYIHGGNGRGKTHLAVALLKSARSLGAIVRFTSAGLYLKAVVATYRKNSRESEKDVLDAHTEPEVLVVDDLGAQRVGDFGLGELLMLVEERGWRGRTTVITSNLTPAELHDKEPRLASRVKEWRIVKLEGEDRRKPEARAKS
jgi:DNA replication protein DnaC